MVLEPGYNLYTELNLIHIIIIIINKINKHHNKMIKELRATLMSQAGLRGNSQNGLSQSHAHKQRVQSAANTFAHSYNKSRGIESKRPTV